MANEITTLKVSFWFGQERPSNNEDMVFSYEFNVDTIVEQWDNFKLTHEEFKVRNTNPVVPYKNCLANEECIIHFEVGDELTTFQELSLMVQYINNTNKFFEKRRTKIDEEIEQLENERYSVVDNTLNKYASQSISLGEVFTQEQINVIEKIYQKNLSYSKLQKELNKYFKKIKTPLNNKGYDYNYLSYAISHSLMEVA